MDDLSALRIDQSFEHFGNLRLKVFYVISSCDENDNCDVLFGYILLIFQFSVECDERIELIPGQGQKFSIALTIPSHICDRLNVMSSE